jgi:hypothetical protein
VAHVQRGVDRQARVQPPKPLFLVANSTLCQVEKLSSWVQLCQLVVNGHLWPLALSLAAASATSGQVPGGLLGVEPGGLEGVLVVVRRPCVELLNGKLSIWPLGAV